MTHTVVGQKDHLSVRLFTLQARDESGTQTVNFFNRQRTALKMSSIGHTSWKFVSRSFGSVRLVHLLKKSTENIWWVQRKSRKVKTNYQPITLKCNKQQVCLRINLAVCLPHCVLTIIRWTQLAKVTPESSGTMSSTEEGLYAVFNDFYFIFSTIKYILDFKKMELSQHSRQSH